MWSDFKRVTHTVFAAKWHGEVPILVWLTPLPTVTALSFYGIPPCCGLAKCSCNPDTAVPSELLGSVNLLNSEFENGFPTAIKTWLEQSARQPKPDSYDWIIFENEFVIGLKYLCEQIKYQGKP